MAYLSLDKLMFVSAIANLQTKVNNVNVSYPGWESQGENSRVFEKYIDGFCQLYSIMNLYQKLVNKDIDAMRSVCEELDAMDLRLKDLWK